MQNNKRNDFDMSLRTTLSYEKLEATKNSLLPQYIIFMYIYIYIFRKKTFIYARLIKKNGTLVVYYLFSCVFIFPN